MGVGQDFVSKLSIQSFPNIIEVLFQEMREESKWKAKVGSLTIGEFIRLICMIEIYCQPFTKNYRSTLKFYMTLNQKLLNSRRSFKKSHEGNYEQDLEPFVEDLIRAMKNRDETEETIQKLGGVVFVQTVEGSAYLS